MFATEEEVPLSAVGTGAHDSLLPLFTGEDAVMLAGNAASLKLLAELEDMPKPFIVK